MKKLIILLFVWLAITVDNVVTKEQKKNYHRSFINPYPRFKLNVDNDDPGEPLFLTDFIHNPKLDKKKVQKMAEVKGTQFLNVTSYAGYLTVDRNYNSNMFFWYFPSKDAIYDPVVVWLQGGPGASSLFGLFTENGPFQFNKAGHLERREYSWSENFNLIYIDNPVGTGFSFTEHEAGYAKNERDVGRNLHEAVMQLYELFQWDMDGKFWVTGESYAGKYVPALAYHIHKVQNAIDTRVHIPLRGVAIGNGLSDPIHQLKYGDYIYQLGLIDDNALEKFHTEEKKGAEFISERKMVEAFNVFDELINGDLSNGSLFHNITGFNFYFNYLKTKDDSPSEIMGKFLQSSSTRRAIHVGNKTFHDLDTENKVEEHLKSDVMDSVAVWIAELLDTYTVCIYNGQLDIIVAYPLTRNYLNKLKFKNASEYHAAKRQIWMVDNEVAGYKKVAGNLIEYLVRNAGHMAPSDQPKWMFDLINNLIK